MEGPSCYLGLSQGVVTNQTICGSPASAAQTCCGAGDICLEDSFCHCVGLCGSNTSGFYIGACTDENFAYPGCSLHCSKPHKLTLSTRIGLTDIGSTSKTDAVYNASTGLWSCCATGDTVNCNDPRDETFQAPGPDELTAVVSSSTTSISSTGTTTSSSMVTTAPPSTLSLSSP